MLLVQLRPSGTQNEQRHPLRPVGQVLEELEQRRVGPVQILEHQHRRPVRRQPLAEAPPGRKRLLLRRRLRHRAYQRRQPRPQPGQIRIVRRQRAFQLRRRLLGRVRLQDPRLRLDDLPQRPEGDPLPVGQTAPLPPTHQPRPLLDIGKQLSAQNRLLPTPGSPINVTS